MKYPTLEKNQEILNGFVCRFVSFVYGINQYFCKFILKETEDSHSEINCHWTCSRIATKCELLEH